MKKTELVLAMMGMMIFLCAYSQAGHRDGGSFQKDSALIVRAGMYLPSGNSLLWEQNEEFLTFRMADWNAFTYGFGFKLGANDHLNVNFCFDYYRKKRATQYRDYVNANGYPITQDLKLTLVPLTVAAEFLPFGRYEEGRRKFGKTPMKIQPFIGAGVGLYIYRYEEIGNQIDFRDMSIYDAYFISEGQAGGVFITGGMDVPIGHNATFTMEGRYHWVKTPLSPDFVGFDDFDLGGAQFMFGFGYRF
ncbi:hypothetical protein ACFLU6_05710 [Acidobacteriota bacterium]